MTKKRKQDKRKHPSAPKHPRTAYNFYVQERFKANKSTIGCIGSQWKALPAKDRNRY